jgi:hypothetical protein
MCKPSTRIGTTTPWTDRILAGWLDGVVDGGRRALQSGLCVPRRLSVHLLPNRKWPV